MIAATGYANSLRTLPKASVSTAPILQRKCTCGGAPGPSDECEECHRKHSGMLQRRARRPQPDNEVPTSVHEVLNSPGQTLDAATRAFMEPRFGHDFSRVRVHTDSRAAESARAVQALAYTVGSHLVFDVGQYAPASLAGQRLLAHELTHVVQQGTGPTRLNAKLEVSAPGDASEREADGMAERVVRSPMAERAADSLLSSASSPSTSPRLMRTTHPNCTPTVTGVSNPDAVIDQAQARAIQAAGAALQELARPSSRTLLLLDQWFHCPSVSDIRQITANLRRIEAALPTLTVRCLDSASSLCSQGYLGEVTDTDVPWCPEFFRRTPAPANQIGLILTAAGRSVGMEDGDSSILDDFTHSSSEMMGLDWTYAHFIVEATRIGQDRHSAIIPCHPVDTSMDVVVPPEAVSNPRLIHRLSPTEAVEPGAIIRRVYRDRSGKEFIYDERLPGASVRLPNETPRYYFQEGHQF